MGGMGAEEGVHMKILEYGQDTAPTLLFLPCTAEPDWAFTDSVTLLSRAYHVFQVVYDGHGGTGEDFVSVAKTIEDVTAWLQQRGITRLDAAYGCSLGGACLTRLLALGQIPVRRAIIDAGMTPYQMPLIFRYLTNFADVVGFKLITRSRKMLELAYPPARWTLPGRDPAEEYDALIAYLRTYSNRTIRRIFWSANNDKLPEKPANTGCGVVYWYGEAEAKARRRNIRFIKRYFPGIPTQEIPQMDHAELVMLHPQEFNKRVTDYLKQA